MFMTLPSFELWVPPPLLPSGAKCWAGFSLEVELPWFLLRLLTDSDGDRNPHTLGLSDVRSLTNLLQSVQVEDVASLHCLALDDRDDERVWRMNRVVGVWRPAAVEREQVPLVFSFEGRPGRFSPSAEPVDEELTRTKLIDLLPA